MNYLSKMSVLLTAFLLFIACSDDNPWVGAEGTGGIRLSLKADANVADAVPQTRATETLTAPDINRFSVKLTKSDFSVDKVYSSVDKFNAADGFGIGLYTLAAIYGDVEDEGFDKPAFYGETTVNVIDGESSDASVTATLANTMVSIDYTDAFKTFFPDYSAQLHSDASANYLDVMKDDAGRPVFLKPGNVALTLNLTQPNTGRTTSIQPAQPFLAKARHHYHITLDYNQGQVGQGQISILFDESVTVEDVILDLSDELFTADPPAASAAGFTPGNDIRHLQGNSVASPVKFNVNAPGKIVEANLSVSSEGKTFSGNKTQINLINASDADKSLLSQWGIDCRGFFKVPDRFAFVDLSKFIEKLPQGTHTVSLQVKDILSHVSEPISATIVVEPMQLTVATPSAFFGDTQLALNVEYNGDNTGNLSFKVLTNSGNYVDAPVISVTPNTRATKAPELKSYKFLLSTPELNRAVVTLRVYFQEQLVDEINFNLGTPQYSVAIDPYSTYFDVKVSAADEATVRMVTNNLRLFISGGASVSPSISRDADAGIIRASGVSPATAYKLQTTVYKTTTPVMITENTFTTEAATPVPNGDFSAVNQNSLNISGLQVGGTWRATALGTHYHTSSILRSEPQGWANLNPLTAYAGSSNKNTWFIVPSVWTENGKTVIRSVGYNHSGTTPDRSGSNFSTTYYCTNTPGESGLVKSVGELFLGSYTFNGAASRTDGIAFASRPVSLSFTYSYESWKGEKGLAYISILDASGSVLAQSDTELDAASEKTVTIALPAYPFASKAAKIKLGFRSVKDDNVSIDIPTGSRLNEGTGLENATLAANQYHAVAVGSVLTISNVSLGYAAPASASYKAYKKSIKRARR